MGPFINHKILVLALFVVTGCSSVKTSERLETEKAVSREPATVPKRVAVYKGPGACDNCPEEIAALARKLGPSYSVELLPPSRIRPEVLRQFDLYIQPGGDNTMHVKKAIGPSGEQAIRDYVAGGGRYLGICLGATLASTGTDEDNRPLFGMLPIASHEIDTANMSARVGEVNISLRGHGRRTVFLQDPPYMRVLPEGRDRVRVLATYPDGRAAAVSGHYGQGSAMLIGPHFEADSSWFSHHGLRDQDGNDQHIFLDFMREALTTNARPFRSAPRSDGESSKGQR